MQLIFRSKLVEKASHMISDDVKNNLADLKKQWKKQKMALYTNSPTRNNFISMRTHDLLPIVVMLITMGSALFTLLIMFNALNNNPSHKNMKYESIEFAHRKKMEQMEKMFPIVDEFGTALGKIILKILTKLIFWNSKSFRNEIKHLTKRLLIENWSKIGRKLVENWSKIGRKFIENWS